MRKLMRYARHSATDDLRPSTDDLRPSTDDLRPVTDDLHPDTVDLHLNVDKNFAEFVVLERFV